MRTRLGILAIVALALTGAACSDDGGGGAVDLDPEAQAYVDAMVEASEDDGGLLFDVGEEATRCLASRWVSVIGVERLEDAGITPADMANDDDIGFDELGLDQGEAEELIDAFPACGIDLRDAMIDSMVADAGDSEVMRSCLEAALTADGIRALMVASFLEGEESLEEGEFDDPEAERAFGAMFGCLFTGAFDPDGFDDDSEG